MQDDADVLVVGPEEVQVRRAVLVRTNDCTFGPLADSGQAASAPISYRQLSRR